MTLLAGVAQVDITPEPGCELMGYGARNAPSTGVHAPLHARAPVHADVEVGETIEFHLRADEALVFPEPE